MRYAGYSETESKDCTLQKRVQQANKTFIEEVQHQKIVLPPFVDTKEQYTASMLTGGLIRDKFGLIHGNSSN